jgi:flagellar FliL protein
MSQQPAAPAAAAPAKSKKTLFFAIAALVVLGGGGAYWKLFVSAPSEAAAEESKEPAEPPAMVPFDPFVVNLSDPGAPRFLRVTMALVVAGEAHAKEFEENTVARMKVRSALLELLSQQRASLLVTPEGRADLKKTIIERAGHNAEELKVNDVLFSEFIVQ